MAHELALIRAAHVAAVILWIGGVAFVTTILLPAIRRDYPPHARMAAFHRFEKAFAWQARLSVLVTGASGIWLAHRLGLWSGFGDHRTWWLPAMAAVWLVFAAILFVLEPFVLPRIMARVHNPNRVSLLTQVAHVALLAVSMITVVGAVAGVHGF